MADNTYTNTYDTHETDTMEPPTKRPRLTVSSENHEEVEEVAEEWDLQAARAQNDMNLKSIFEGIFAKYGQDFTEVGDEIDLETGDIIVDNGHLLGLEEEGRGDQDQPWHSEDDAASGNEENTEPRHEGGGPLPGDGGLEPEESSKLSGENSQVPPGDNEEHPSSRDNALTSASDNPKTIPIAEQPQVLEPPPLELGPRDPVWQVPDLPQSFSTPTAERSRSAKVAFAPRLPDLDKRRSPPGSGSLWSVSRQRRPRSERKPKATPSKSRPRAKRKYHSSPVAFEALDWSFADIPEEDDESDDPLQEHQPSPTPSRSINIRRKRMRISAKTDSRLVNPFEQYSKLSTSAEPGPQDQSATATPFDASHRHVEQQQDAQPSVANSIEAQCDSPAHSTVMHDVVAHASTPVPVSAPAPAPVSPVELPSPGTSPRGRYGLTPDETRLVVYMRYVDKRSWPYIHRFVPNKTLRSIQQWSLHWSTLRAHPPKLHGPWLQSEIKILDQLQHQKGLSWGEMRAKLPIRTKLEIEFELLRLWAGDEVWYSDDNHLPRQDSSGPSSEGHHDSPGAHDHSAAMEVEEQEVSEVRSDPPQPASQTPTVYLISDDEEMDDNDTLSNDADGDADADTAAKAKEEVREMPPTPIPSTPQRPKLPCLDPDDPDVISINWSMPGTRDTRTWRSPTKTIDRNT